ncbi:MAG: bifunctional riboflavin kinase/FAD synthetase [Gammaproteobacteria bacterium]|nr:bifunctional riboflavin kinase/FAD synthetase [Gammaproteobacteria bacterium]MCW5582666.1 bifunctional riboflavin kinase/FAD synthetase [Gammaproteobacteria bacterium]
MPAKLIRSTYNLQPEQQGGVVTMGNFDGVHLGHQQLVAATVKKAKLLNTFSLVITFEPHAFEYFAGDNVVVPRLTRLREKFTLLAACGVDNILVLPFNHKLAAMSASDFVTKILFNSLRSACVIVGDDFRFGRERSGDFDFLKDKGKRLGFMVESLPTVRIDDERVSSTRVRKALAAGDLALAKHLLGHSYSMLGRVTHGDQRGRILGFPTANIYLHRKLTPIRGVYAVLIHGVADRSWPGVANVGVRPTVDGTRTILEVHLLNFNQEIYGHYIQIEFCEKLRDEARYSSLDLLKQQIARDVEVARNYFINHGVI